MAGPAGGHCPDRPCGHRRDRARSSVLDATRSAWPDRRSSLPAWLAHAEVNGLIWLRDGRQRHAFHRQVSSLEPCPMCTGAFRMAALGASGSSGRTPSTGLPGCWPRTSTAAGGRSRSPGRVATPPGDWRPDGSSPMSCGADPTARSSQAVGSCVPTCWRPVSRWSPPGSSSGWTGSNLGAGRGLGAGGGVAA